MAFVDPRERYDDLLVRETSETLDPDTFDEHAQSEAVEIGWVVVGYVFDRTGQILLIEEPWADGWKTPAGVPKPEESLRDALAREVHEETGVRVRPGRPHAIEEYTMIRTTDGNTAEFTCVSFQATALTTAIDDELGVRDERITDAAWFDDLPAALYHSLTEPVYRRCQSGTSTSESA